MFLWVLEFRCGGWLVPASEPGAEVPHVTLGCGCLPLGFSPHLSWWALDRCTEADSTGNWWTLSGTVGQHTAAASNPGGGTGKVGGGKSRRLSRNPAFEPPRPHPQQTPWEQNIDLCHAKPLRCWHCLFLQCQLNVSWLVQPPPPSLIPYPALFFFIAQYYLVESYALIYLFVYHPFSSSGMKTASGQRFHGSLFCPLLSSHGLV